ncbi:hypothetical protein Vretifemale_18442 [Volvox reticuliferus]|uniref:Fanconi-associated nuclease n=1 Tax=Volvox reticuliferus TaxID=1737510 RepID=A0A8J4FZQ2_9CHLO|nr:hypothetical protein Vretifemale_18442 [Volvox reticuliferus]
MALRGQGSLQLLLGKSVFGAKKRKAGKKKLDALTKRQRTSDGGSEAATKNASPPRPPIAPRLPRQQQSIRNLSNEDPSRELQHSHQLHPPGLPTPPDGTGWIRIETNVVGLRFRRSSSDAAAATAAAAAAAAAAAVTAPQLGLAIGPTSMDPLEPSVTSAPPRTGGPRYRLAPEPTNLQDANAVQVLQCASPASAAGGGSGGDDRSNSNRTTAASAAAAPCAGRLLVGYLPAVVAAHLAPLLRAGLLDTQVHVCWSEREGAGTVPLVMYVRATDYRATCHDGRPGTAAITTTSATSAAAAAATSATSAAAAAATFATSAAATAIIDRVSEAPADGGCGGVDVSAADDALVDACCDDADEGELEAAGGGGGVGRGAAGGNLPEAGGAASETQASIQAALAATAAAAAEWLRSRSSRLAAGEVLRANFAMMTEDVRRHDGHLLSSDEHALLGRLLELPAPAQCLFLRLLLRRGPWFALASITYPECGDVAVAAEALVAAGLAARPHQEDWPQVAELLPVTEVRALAAAGSKHVTGRQSNHLIARRHLLPHWGSQPSQSQSQPQSQPQVHRKSSILAYTVSKDGVYSTRRCRRRQSITGAHRPRCPCV